MVGVPMFLALRFHGLADTIGVGTGFALGTAHGVGPELGGAVAAEHVVLGADHCGGPVVVVVVESAGFALLVEHVLLITKVCIPASKSK